MVESNQTSNKALLTDLYQLTMMAAYLDNGKEEDIATFDLFIRKLPKDWGYFIANGIEDAIDYITNIEFSEDDINYLREQGLFKEEFLEYLKSFKFEGEVYAVKEGTPVFPNELILRVTAKRSQAQFIESAVLNIINFQTMIASKANRVVNAVTTTRVLGASPAKVVDFGLRRAQEEDAGMKGARAAYIGGAVATSNVKAGKEYGIPISGTHAHSFVMSFDSEIEAFRAYVKTFPNNATLLIDTYDTLQGARNAAIVAKELENLEKHEELEKSKELEKAGEAARKAEEVIGKAREGVGKAEEKEKRRLGAVRLDSGDLCDLSIKVRQILDENGLHYVKIFASNDLNEYKIADLVRQGAKIDGYGVGTEMITAKPVAAVSGVYKLVEDEAGAKIKLSSGKKTYPGRKQVYRVENRYGMYAYDVLALDGELALDSGQNSETAVRVPLLEQVVSNGNRTRERRNLGETREYALSCVKKLPDFLRTVRVLEAYDVRISEGLSALVESSTERFQAKAATVTATVFNEGDSVNNTVTNLTKTTSGGSTPNRTASGAASASLSDLDYSWHYDL